MEQEIKIKDESEDKKMLWETIGKPAYEKGLLEGRQESGLFAIIPMSILENKTLSANAKLLYGEIMALSKKSGLCYATNEYMAEMLGLSKTSIPQILRELSGCGLIFIVIERNHKGTYRNITTSFFNEGGHNQRTRRGIVKERGGALLDNKDKREINKVEIDNKKECETSTEVVANTFSFNSYLEEIALDKRRHIQIIALYWKWRGIKFDTKKLVQEALNRNCRPAKALVDYSNKEITDTMDYIDSQSFIKKPTLETVNKYIAELKAGNI